MRTKESSQNKATKTMRVYAVNCDKGRGERLLSAAAPLKMDIVLVPSPLRDDPEVVRRGKTCFERDTSYPTGFAATIGHLRCMQRFLEDGGELGIIIEDDVRFHVLFWDVVNAVKPRLENGESNVISLGYVNRPNGECIVVGGHYLVPNVGVSNPWGAQCYLLTRKWAQKWVETFSVDDVSIPYASHFVTDWVLFDPILGCKRDALMLPIAIESPDEQTIAGSTNKPDIIAQCGLDKTHFHL